MIENLSERNIIMEREFVPYEIALAMKDLGFDEPCFNWYGFSKKVGDNPSSCCNSYGFIQERKSFCSAPLYQQAFRWFREEYGLLAEFCWNTPNKKHATMIYPTDFYYQSESYEEAQDACLNKLIKMVKENEGEGTK